MRSSKNITKHLTVRPFTPEERTMVLQAKKQLGMDMPTFYHTAICRLAEETVKTSDARG